MLNLDDLLAQIRQCQPLLEKQMKQLCQMVTRILAEESTVQLIQSPVNVVGDVHGQFYDLLELFRVGGELPQTKYVMMGDFVDRGYFSLETWTLLLLLKARYPDRITLLRGNHESRQITQVYGYYDECMQKYGNSNVWRYSCQVFDHLSLAALIDGRILCVHGGISPDISTIDGIRKIDRVREIPHSGPFCDLMWSDPEEIEGWQVSPRGAGWLFGSRVVREFNHLNGTSLIARAHQLVQEGFKFMYQDESLVTVWSAPNYCYRCGNVAAVMCVDESHIDEHSFKIFDAVPDQERLLPQRNQPSEYFM